MFKIMKKKTKKKTTTPERSHSNIFVLVESNALLLKYLQKLRDVYKRIEKKDIFNQSFYYHLRQ